MTSRVPVIVAFVAVTLSAVFAMPVEEVASLDRLPGATVPVLVNFHDIELSKVVSSLAAAGPFKVKFDDDVAEQRVTVDLEKQPLKDVLVYLATTYALQYRVTERGVLIVSRRREAE